MSKPESPCRRVIQSCVDCVTGTSSDMGGGPTEGDGYSDWMSELPEPLWTQPLSSLAIPGSHDSFTYFLDEKGPFGPTIPASLKDMAKLFGNMMKTIVHKWSMTQHRNATQQLEAGIRYFDMRISTKPGFDGYYSTHGLFGMKMDSTLAEINGFLEEHPKEIVLLDLNHFYNMSPDDHLQCMDLLQEIFGPKMCPYIEPENVNLDFLWENELQVLIFYQDEVSLTNPVFWPDTSIMSPWPNVVSTPSLLKILEKNYEGGRQDARFYITQGILTPDTSYIISHLGGSLEGDLADKVAQPVVDWIKTKERGLSKGLNVCILDFIHLSSYIPNVIALNHRDL